MEGIPHIVVNGSVLACSVEPIQMIEHPRLFHCSWLSAI